MPEPVLDAPFSPDDRPPEERPVIVDEMLVADIDALVRDGQRGMVLNLVADLHPADLAVLVHHLPPDTAPSVFAWLPPGIAGAVLPELESAQRTDLLEELPPQQVADLLDEIDSDDAADILAELPDEVAEAVLPEMEFGEDALHLLSYPADTAGRLMETDYVAVSVGATVAEATEELRRCAETVDPVYVVYVVDDEHRLQGLVELKRLLLARSRAPVVSIMDVDFVSVEPDRDQEEVARMMERYDLVTLPVVSAGGRLLGRITIDDVVDVIREEAEEDFQRASGLSGEEEVSSSVLAVSRGRLPWLFVGLVGATLSGFVISQFEDGLQKAVVLATFIPIVTAMGGNAAVQSGAIAVQGLATGDLWTGDVGKRLLKEASVALLNGVVLATVIAAVILLLGYGGGTASRLALTVGLTLFAVILQATTNGAVVPLLLARVGMDPSLSMGPFVTTVNDIIGLAIFFSIASVLYL